MKYKQIKLNVDLWREGCPVKIDLIVQSWTFCHAFKFFYWISMFSETKTSLFIIWTSSFQFLTMVNWYTMLHRCVLKLCIDDDKIVHMYIVQCNCI